jgi:hypothetical protein
MNIKILTKYFIIFIIILSSCSEKKEHKKIINPDKKTIINLLLKTQNILKVILKGIIGTCKLQKVDYGIW